MFIEQIFLSPYETVTTGFMLGFLYFGAIDILSQDDSLLWGLPVHYRMFSYVPGFSHYLPVAHLSCDNKKWNVSWQCQMSPRAEGMGWGGITLDW